MTEDLLEDEYTEPENPHDFQSKPGGLGEGWILECQKCGTIIGYPNETIALESRENFPWDCLR